MNDDRAVGVIVGAAAGDALGWPQEDRSQIVGGSENRNVRPSPQFRAWERNGGTQYGRYIDPVEPGSYSDDTQLMLAVARACQQTDWYQWLTNVELPFWPTYQRGGGRAVLSASRAWANGRPPWDAATAKDEQSVARYFGAGANGVAMRIAPHAVACNGKDLSELAVRVVKDGITTHGHPRALVGGVVHAIAITHALNQHETLGYGELLHRVLADKTWRDPGVLLDAVDDSWLAARERYSAGSDRRGPDESWTVAVDELDHLLRAAANGLSHGATANDQRILEELGVFGRQGGSGTVSTAAAMYMATRTASRPMSGVLRSGFLKDADTDTLCSMTASLLGAVHGTSWLGSLFAHVQDRDYLIEVALRLAQQDQSQQPRSGAPSPDERLTTSRIRRWVKALFDGDTATTMPDGRAIRSAQIAPLESRTRQYAARAVLRTDDGQSLIIDRVSKVPIPSTPVVESPADQGPQRTPRGPQDSGSEPAAAPGLPDRSREGQQRTAGDGPEHPSIADRGDQRVSFTAVQIRVPDPTQTTRFFEEVLQLPVRQLDPDRFGVGDFLIVAATQPGVEQEPSDLTLILKSAQLDEVQTRASAFAGAKVQLDESRGQLWVRIPGTLLLKIVRSGPHDNSESDHAQ